MQIIFSGAVRVAGRLAARSVVVTVVVVVVAATPLHKAPNQFQRSSWPAFLLLTCLAYFLRFLSSGNSN